MSDCFDRDAKAVFLTAVESYAPVDWDAYLTEACGTDAGLRSKVEALLRAHQDDDSVFGDGAIGLFPISSVERELTQVGQYKLLQEIGEGGFGVVYMAEQPAPLRRTVAVKVIKPGMDTRDVIARFEAERQAVALMDHPNIAKVYDAGTTERGLPYFVMELVNGYPITEFCDTHRLSTSDRLRLFETVCRAVHHAHQKGIIHRDLKPRNILVSMHNGKPAPVIIDFGVAKAVDRELTEKTLFTAYGQMIGTPQYMSPEQAEMTRFDIDTRSDIYSLGVLLYELLSGSTPLEAKRLSTTSYAEMQRLIREDETPRPSMRLRTLGADLDAIARTRDSTASGLSRLVRGDLDWIAMKALEKDRTRRYDTASSFADDVARFLRDEPVEACPPSVSYRFKKSLRRHKVAFLTTGLVATAMLAGTVSSVYLAVKSIRARDSEAIQRGLATAAEKRIKKALVRVTAENEKSQQREYDVDSLLIQKEWESHNMIVSSSCSSSKYPAPTRRIGEGSSGTIGTTR